MLFAVAWGLSQIMTPRAAYIHVGVLLGTLMTGNVWMVIIPSQRDLVDATREGREQDRALSLRAKQRSIHNNYMTFPLIFIMVSNHFPSTYSHQLNWLILAVLMVGGALVRHFMNIRFGFPGWRLALGGCAVGVGGDGVALTLAPARSGASDAELAAGPPVPFQAVQAIVSLRCVACHSATPSDTLFKVAPNGLMLDTPEQIAAAARRIRVRVEGGTMPFANRTAHDRRRAPHRGPLGRPGRRGPVGVTLARLGRTPHRCASLPGDRPTRSPARSSRARCGAGSGRGRCPA